MVKFKLTISNPKNGSAHSLELDEPYSLNLIGKKIGEVIDGSLIGVEYKKLKITGGSDKSGFPMRPDVPGGRKAYILTGKGIGLRTIKGKTKKGYRRRILVRGNTITPDIYQINMVILE
jgi:small subunit ribosomal protein S6e